MKKRWVLVALALTLAMLTAPALAISRWGKIDGTYSYDDLEIKDLRTGGCVMRGTIKNNSSEMKDGIFITFYAWDRFGKLLWKNIVAIKAIEPKGEAEFSERFYGCDEQNPHKLTFDVVD